MFLSVLCSVTNCAYNFKIRFVVSTIFIVSEVVGYTECSILSPKGKGNLEITFSVGLDKQQY